LIKILWISHDPIRISSSTSASVSGFWKESLLKVLDSSSTLNIRVAHPGDYSVSKMDSASKDSFQFRIPSKRVYTELPDITVQDMLKIIENYEPDLIHVHGTEKPYGLITKYTCVPVVVSLQGFLSESYYHVLGNIPVHIWQKEKTFKEYVKRNSFLDLHKYWYENSFCEMEILRVNKTLYWQNII
jgi:hypothetical protein